MEFKPQHIMSLLYGPRTLSLKTRISDDYLISDSNGDRAQLLIKLRSFFDIPIILSAQLCRTGFIGRREYSPRDRKRESE